MKDLVFSAGRIATLACLLEVAAPKPGNVHRGADFDDVTLEDFMTSAVVFGQIIDDCRTAPVGKTIKTAIEQTHAAVGTNTNLGMVLLLVPLAKAIDFSQSSELPPSALSRHSVQMVLDRLTSADAADVFAAIRLAKPGRLGKFPQLDVNDPNVVSPTSLIVAMELAADRDLVARQFANGFEQVFEFGVPQLLAGRKRFKTLSEAIVFAHVSVMASFPDSLIARKCGAELAVHSQMLAQKALDKLGLENEKAKILEQTDEAYWAAVAELDFWLRSDGHKRNPGTSADLIAASLFVAIQRGELGIAERK